MENEPLDWNKSPRTSQRELKNDVDTFLSKVNKISTKPLETNIQKVTQEYSHDQ